ncbi:MAG: NigD-like C-terminal domain-containing protein [Rikenellaceae bacterium]
MKTRSIFSLFAVALVALFVTSCDKNDNEWDLPNLYTYATVMEVEQSAQTTEASSIYFERDNGETFNIGENKSTADYSKLTVGERVVMGVTLLETDNETFDYTATLYELITVLMGEFKTVTTEEENEAIADDALDYIAKDATLTLGYLNLYVGFSAKSLEDIAFYLVENAIVDEATEDDGDYLALELRYDSNGADGAGTEYGRYVSFDMSEYSELLEGKDGISLRVLFDGDKTVEMEIDSKDLFPAE